MGMRLLLLSVILASFTAQGQITHTGEVLRIDDVDYEEVGNLEIISPYEIVKSDRSRRRQYVHILPAGHTAVMQRFDRGRWLDRHNCGLGCFGSGAARNTVRVNVELRYDTGGFQRYESRAVMRNAQNEIVYIRYN